MTAAIALARLRDLGVSVVARGEGLALQPASIVPADLLAELRTHKADVLALLAANDSDVDPDADAERAAIQAESALPAPGTAERAALDSRHAATVSAFLRISLQRPPSWADPTARPSPGAFCSCCRGQRWWCEIKCRRRQSGWRCWTCHPPDHLAAGDVECVTT
jgi:hypothetical protein